MNVTRRLFVAGTIIPVAGHVAGAAHAQPRATASSLVASNLTTLRAIPAPAEPAAGVASQEQAAHGMIRLHLEDFDGVGDGGGGEFVWAPTSEAADDNGTVIQPTGLQGPGRWVRVIVDSINVRWFGAKADGTGNAAGAINAAFAAAARLRLPLLLSGTFRLEGSIVFSAAVDVRAAATLVAADGKYNSVPYWNGEPSGRHCLIDLAYGRFSTISGRLVVRAEDPTKPPPALAAIGSSKGIYSELLPNPNGRGGSNTTWQSVEIYDLDYGFFTPERGAAVPSGLPAEDQSLARPDWQPSAAARANGSFAPLTYRQGDHVILGRDVYECVSPGTPTTGPAPGSAPSLAARVAEDQDNWEYLADEPLQGVAPWTPGRNVVTNTLVTSKGGTYRALKDGQSGSAPPDGQGAVVQEQAVNAWAAGETPELLSFRVHDNRFYRLVALGKDATAGKGPEHTDGRPVSDANGWSWAYAGPATSPTWRYLRKTSYSAAGTGMVIGHFWAQNVGVTWTSSATATDDSCVVHFRAQSCRDTAIRINGGTFSAVNVYIHGARGRFMSGPDDMGAAAVQNFGSYNVDSTYVDGEWTRGIVLGHGSDTQTTFKADGGFKTSTGAAIEAHPQARKLRARIRSSAVNATQPVRDFAYLRGQGPFVDGETIRGPRGKAIVLSSHRGISTDETLVIYRLSSGTILPGDDITGARSRGQVVTAGQSPGNTLATGLVGIPTILGGTERQIDVEVMGKTWDAAPFRALGQGVLPTYSTRDQLRAHAADGISRYCFRAGALRRAAEDGYLTLGNIPAVVDIDPLEGTIQLLTIASPDAQIRLPGTAGSSADMLKRGSQLLLEIANPGVAKSLFFIDSTHPAPLFVGGQPNWPDKGTVVLKLWIYNEVPWRAVVLGGGQATHPIPTNSLRPTGGWLDQPASSRSPGYRYILLPQSGESARATPIWFEWMPPESWNRGPVRFRFRWVGEKGPGRHVAYAVEGRVQGSGEEFPAPRDASVALTGEGRGADAFNLSSESADVLIAEADSWQPGRPIQFRLHRAISREQDPLRANARLLGVDLLYHQGELGGLASIGPSFANAGNDILAPVEIESDADGKAST